jgi:transcriptional regulator GlxA family with amidase domain
MNDVKTQSVGFLIFEGFPMACLTSMIEPLRAANEISGQEAFPGHSLLRRRQSCAPALGSALSQMCLCLH